MSKATERHFKENADRAIAAHAAQRARDMQGGGCLWLLVALPLLGLLLGRLLS